MRIICRHDTDGCSTCEFLLEEREEELAEIGALMTQYVDVVDLGDLLGSLRTHFILGELDLDEPCGCCEGECE